MFVSNVVFMYLYVRMIDFANPRVLYEISLMVDNVSMLDISSGLRSLVFPAITMHL